MQSETIKLFGKDFSLSPEKHNYLKVCNRFTNLANEARNLYVDNFNQKIHSMEDIEEKNAMIVKIVYSACSEKILKFFSEYDIFDISSDDIVTAIYKQGNGERVTLEVLDKYFEIEATESVRDYERKVKQQTRQKWDSYDFWYDGAAKGAVKAGAMNIVSGAGHSLSNAIDKAASSAAAALKKSELFDNEKKDMKIANAVWLDVSSTGLYYMSILKERGKSNFALISQKEADEAKTLFANCTKLVADSEKKKELLYRVLLLYGMNTEYYTYALKEFPDEARSLITIANWYYVNISNDIDSFMNNYLETLLSDKQADLKNVKLELCKKMDDLELTNCSALSKINDMIDEELMQKITENYKTSTLEQCRVILSNVKASQVNKNIKGKYSRKLKDRIYKLEDEILTKLTYDFENANVEQCKNMLKSISQADVSEKSKNEYLDIINQRIRDILTNEDSNTFNQILIDTDFNNSESIKKSKEIINNSAKTDIKSDYIKALDGTNSKSIKKAHKYYVYKQKGFFKFHALRLLILTIVLIVYICFPDVTYDENIQILCGLYMWYFIGYMIYVNKMCKSAYNLLTVNDTVINKAIINK